MNLMIENQGSELFFFLSFFSFITFPSYNKVTARSITRLQQVRVA